MTTTDEPRLPRTRRGLIACRAPVGSIACVAAVLAILVTVIGAPSTVRAADPSGRPSALPSARPDSNTEVWFDQPMPDDIRAGQTIPLSFTVWDVARKEIRPIDQVELRVHAATGKAAPAQAEATADWPGHFSTTITVPKAGLGQIDVGLLGEICQDDGSCAPSFLPMVIGGIGPPPDAKLPALVTAMIHLPRGPYAVGATVQLDAVLEPRGQWALSLPAALLAVASTPRGADLGTANLLATGPASGHYLGSITIAEPGQVSLVLAIPAERGLDEVIDGSRLDLTFVGPGGSGAPQPDAIVPVSASTLPIIPILVVTAIVLASLVIKRVFADL
jgi:hypothetical protein